MRTQKTAMPKFQESKLSYYTHASTHPYNAHGKTFSLT